MLRFLPFLFYSFFFSSKDAVTTQLQETERGFCDIFKTLIHKLIGRNEGEDEEEEDEEE